MSSSALLNMEALSMVIRWPMLQLGWVAASSGVAKAIRSSGQSRNAPPEAVIVTRSTAAASSPASAWKMAECSLSTGRMRAPWRRAVSISRGPAATRLSLLARASVVPCSRAASPGASPAMPTIADMNHSAGRAAASMIAASPAAASMPLPESAARRSGSRAGSAVTAISAPNSRASAARRAMFCPPVRATTL